MPEGQYPTVYAGQVLTAGLLQSFAPLRAWKASSSTYSSATLADDADLQLPVVANAWYDVAAVIFFSTATSGDVGMNAELYGPAGAAWTLALLAAIVSGATVGPNVNTASTGLFELHTPGATSAITAATFKGTLNTGGTPGTFGFEFAEHTSGDPVTVLAGSQLTAARIA
jgi:hypothetical protein